MSFTGMSCSEVELQTVYTRPPVQVEQESSEEPPMDEWSSLNTDVTISDNAKRAAYKLGKYDPGSGEVCAEYVALSDSTVHEHPYYKYPGNKDPGIMEALILPEPKHVYNEIGQELYLDLCEEIKVIPVKKFYRSLLEKEINLKFYGVNPVGIRAMCLSLRPNRIVKRLDLTSNFLSHDACYHLGQLLKYNNVLDELVLAQCKIGPLGLMRISPHLRRRTMAVLDVSSNELGDEGLPLLVDALANGAVIKRLNLSHNSLGTESAMLLAEVLESNTTITHLNISWNQLYDKRGSDALMNILSKSDLLIELNLSWNNLTTKGSALQSIFKAPKLEILDLSNNRLGKASAKAIARGLQKSKKLSTLDLSYNPLSSHNAHRIVQTLHNQKVRLVNLFMAGVEVTKEFRTELDEILEKPFRSKLIVTYDRVCRDYVVSNRDMREIVLKRLDYVFARSSKKCKVDISLYFMELYKERKEDDYMLENEFIQFMKSSNLAPDNDIVSELHKLFPGPKIEKGGRSIKLSAVVEYIHRLWPEKRLPPTPSLSPPPPPPEKKKETKKNKPKK